MLDKKDDEVYAYDTSGNSTGGFDLNSANKDAKGITANGGSIWVTDNKRDVAYKYTTSGTFLGTDFSLASSNGNSTGLAAIP